MDFILSETAYSKYITRLFIFNSFFRNPKRSLKQLCCVYVCLLQTELNTLNLIYMSHDHTLSLLWSDGARQDGQRSSLRNVSLSQAWKSDTLYSPQATKAQESVLDVL